MSNLEPEKVLLLNEWLGHPKGSIVSISRHKAVDLVERGVAETISEEPKKEEKPKKAKKEEKPKKKMVGRPPKNKMVTSSKNK